jgi:hypothetical protein
MTTVNFCFYLQNRLIQTSQTGGQQYSDTSPFSIPAECCILLVLGVTVLSVIMLSVVRLHVVMLSFIMTSVVMLNAAVLGVVAPKIVNE